MSRRLQTKFFATSSRNDVFGVFRKIRKYWIWPAGRKWVLAEKLCVEGRRLWDNGDKKFGCQFLWTQPFSFCEFSPLFFVWLYIINPIYYNHYWLTRISLSLVFPFLPDQTSAVFPRETVPYSQPYRKIFVFTTSLGNMLILRRQRQIHWG